MRYWVALVVALSALVADWRLPPDATPPRSGAPRSEAEVRLGTLSADYRATGEAIRRHRWSDSLSTLVLAGAVGGVAVAAPESAEVRDGLLQALERSVRAEVARLGPTDMVFGFVYQANRQGPNPYAPGPDLVGRARIETYHGSLEGRAYCLQVRVIHPGGVSRDIEERLGLNGYSGLEASAVGACRPYLRHGAPGPRVQRWLEEGALAFASRSDESEPAATTVLRRRSVFGGVGLTTTALPVEADQCRAGRAASCGRMVLEPLYGGRITQSEVEVVRRSPATGIGSASPYSRWLPDHEYMLADLEADFGAPAFRAFWTSDLAVGAAFEQAFDIDAGSWTVRWIDATVGVDDPGPGLPRSAGTGSLAAVALLLAIAAARQRKRELPC